MKHRDSFGLAVLALTIGCTIEAPPPEDVTGEGMTVADGRVSIDDSQVPVVDACANGQLVARKEGGWECVEQPSAGGGDVLAGEGIVASENGADVTLAIDDSRVPVVDGCTTGQLISRSDGGWECVEPPAGSGDVLAGAGIVASADGADVTLAIDDSRVPVVDGCTTGQLISRSDGGWECVEPPAGSGEVLAGDGIVASDSGADVTVAIDNSRVPVVDSCTTGQLVARGSGGWECVAPVVGGGQVLAGEGILASLNGADVTLAVNFGEGAGQVAAGASLATVRTTADDAQTRVGQVETNVTALQARTLSDFFINACDTAAAGGLHFDAVSGALQLCDGAVFRDLALASAASSGPATLFHRLMTPRWLEVNATWGDLRPSTISDTTISVGADMAARRARILTLPLLGPDDLDPASPVVVRIVVNRVQPSGDNDPAFGIADGLFGDDVGARTFVGVEVRDGANEDYGYLITYPEDVSGPAGSADGLPNNQVLSDFDASLVGFTAGHFELMFRIEPGQGGADANVTCILRAGIASSQAFRALPFSLANGISFSVYGNDSLSELYDFFNFEVTVEREG